MTPFNQEPQAAAPPKVPGNPVMDKFLTALSAINGAQAPETAAAAPPMSNAMPTPQPEPMGLPPRDGFAMGGDVGLGSWDATVSGPSFGDQMSNVSDAANKFFPQEKQSSSGSNDPGAEQLAQQQQALSAGLSRITQPRQQFADGGSAQPWGLWTNDGSSVPEMKPYQGSSTVDVEPSYAGVLPREEARPASGTNFLSKVGETIKNLPQTMSDNFMRGGVYERDQWGNRGVPTRGQDFASLALGLGGETFAGGAAALRNMQEDRYKSMEAERAAAALLGKFRGQSTMAAKELGLRSQLQPYTIEHLKAQTEMAKLNADKPYQLQLAAIPAMRAEMAQIDNNEAAGVFSLDPTENARLANEMRSRTAARHQQSTIDATSVPRSGQTPVAPARPAPPPIPGARLAPNGNYYVPDPDRPGKYLRVEQ